MQILAFISLCLISICLPVASQTKGISSYGIGVAITGIDGATRCGTRFYPIVMLAPIDGGRSLSPTPTFYWFVALPSKSEEPTRVDFILRDSNDIYSMRIFSKSMEVKRSGLYKFTVPESVRLKDDTIQRWQLRFTQDRNLIFHNSVNTVLLAKNPLLEQQIKLSHTEREKAQIYAENYYWYDAFDAYSKWLEANPNDKAARRDRLNILQSVIGTDNKRKCGDGKYVTTVEINAM